MARMDVFSPTLRRFVLERIFTAAANARLWPGRAVGRLRRVAVACRVVPADALGCAGGAPAAGPPVSDRASDRRIARRRGFPIAAGAQPHAVCLGYGAEGRRPGPDGRIHFPDAHVSRSLHLGRAAAAPVARSGRGGIVVVTPAGPMAGRIGLCRRRRDGFCFSRRVCAAGLLGEAGQWGMGSGEWETERRRDGETERRGDGGRRRTYVSPSLRLSVSPSLRL